ncbi:hypothetical protein B0H10DRAFT_2443110 [Mycena sp. CBHHK59/15]|nr:hypothetical protein B0H10DRAFT_2443110 [Mycena sp. CBHHK59/15]
MLSVLPAIALALATAFSLLVVIELVYTIFNAPLIVDNDATFSFSASLAPLPTPFKRKIGSSSLSRQNTVWHVSNPQVPVNPPNRRAQIPVLPGQYLIYETSRPTNDVNQSSNPTSLNQAVHSQRPAQQRPCTNRQRQPSCIQDCFSTPRTQVRSHLQHHAEAQYRARAFLLGVGQVQAAGRR